MRLQDYDSQPTYSAKVLTSDRITSESVEEVREIVFEVEDCQRTYEIGQSIGVIVEGPHDLGHSHHFRLYTVADITKLSDDKNPILTICVKRCNYIDDFSGEEYQGIASNFLCDLRPDDNFTINGPFGIPFVIPKDKTADLVLISMGTGIAPFRAFVKKIYSDIGSWEGKVELFHGARSGLDLLYMNDEKDDFSQYYDEDTFEAFKALSPRPSWSDPIAMDAALQPRAQQIVKTLMKDNTHIYICGREDILATLDRVFIHVEGSKESWETLKSNLKAQNRWAELIY